MKLTKTTGKEILLGSWFLGGGGGGLPEGGEAVLEQVLQTGGEENYYNQFGIVPVGLMDKLHQGNPASRTYITARSMTGFV